MIAQTPFRKGGTVTFPPAGRLNSISLISEFAVDSHESQPNLANRLLETRIASKIDFMSPVIETFLSIESGDGSRDLTDRCWLNSRKRTAKRTLVAGRP